MSVSFNEVKLESFEKLRFSEKKKKVISKIFLNVWLVKIAEVIYANICSPMGSFW